MFVAQRPPVHISYPVLVEDPAVYQQRSALEVPSAATISGSCSCTSGHGSSSSKSSINEEYESSTSSADLKYTIDTSRTDVDYCPTQPSLEPILDPNVVPPSPKVYNSTVFIIVFFTVVGP
ncbi:hypothetical protein BGX23_007560 [Mortierella sp. AD031]|nr:hypothetical protein BGX23_007560 [Mortierella sp. AD031]